MRYPEGATKDGKLWRAFIKRIYSVNFFKQIAKPPQQRQIGIADELRTKIGIVKVLSTKIGNYGEP